MLIWLGEPDYKLITAVEGTGDNLTDEDIKNGYVDYLMTSVYEQDGEEMVLKDGGQLLLTKHIDEFDDDEELVELLIDYWDGHNDYSILDY